MKKTEKFYDKHYGEITLFRTARNIYNNKLNCAKITPKAEYDELQKYVQPDRAKM